MYPSWGHDIDKKTTPFHLNREYHVSFEVNKKTNLLLLLLLIVDIF
jgi:hypothetical protein